MAVKLAQSSTVDPSDEAPFAVDSDFLHEEDKMARMKARKAKKRKEKRQAKKEEARMIKTQEPKREASDGNGNA